MREARRIPVAGVTSARSVQTFKAVKEEYGVEDKFAAVQPIHWRKGKVAVLGGAAARRGADAAQGRERPAASTPGRAGVPSHKFGGQDVKQTRQLWLVE